MRNSLHGPSPEQLRVIETWGQGMAVLAGAGSGKTTTLVTKCAKLIEQNPQARFAAVSFTERSASDLRVKLTEALSRSGGSGALHSHWVMTIHGLCGAIIREYPREAGFDGEESVLSETEAQLLWERAIEALWLEDLSDELRSALENLLDRESRESVFSLLKRIRDLFSFGILSVLEQSADSASRDLARLAHYVLERYSRLKRRKGAIDFHDLERGADRALEFQNVRDAYHRRFELVLVDEFQDTNPLQAKMIWRFARPDRSNLCVVGDPKQSIYRFRDADVSVFEEFCSQLPVQQSLTWNFRSRPAIIEFANHVCAKAFDDSQMKFESLSPQREAISEVTPVLRLDITEPKDLGLWIKAEMNRGIPLDKMVLLLRKIRGNEKWLKALTSAGIPIAVGSGGLFWEDPRVREMVSFLRWWDNPGHTLSGAVFLRAPWMGLSDLELDDWVKQDPTWREPFFSSQHELAKRLKGYLHQIVRPGELLLSLLIDSKVENELGVPLLGLWHRVEELSSRGLDFHAVVMELTLALEEGRREREVPAPRNLGQLPILTFHSAKGLEFEHVILVDFGEKTRASDAPLLFWDRKDGAYFGRRDSEGERDRKNPDELRWRQLEKDKNLAESKRLFYVALTRARERLVLVCPELSQGDTDLELVFDPQTAFQQDDWRAWIECSDLEIPQVSTRDIQILHPSQRKSLAPSPSFKTLQANQTRVPQTRPRHSVTEWTLLARCPRAYEWTFIRPRIVTQKSEVTDEENSNASSVNELSYSELGNRVHQCLEQRDFEGLKKLEEEVGPERLKASPLIQWAKTSPWMVPACAEKGRDVWTELEFEVPVGKEVLVGVMDRLICEKVNTLGQYSGQYSVIDFKVTEKRKSWRRLIDAYQTQIELYAFALRALQKNIAPEAVRALLVNISADSVQVVPIRVGNLNVESLAYQAYEITNGKAGVAKPGEMCRFCQFQPECPEGLKLKELEPQGLEQDQSQDQPPLASTCIESHFLSCSNVASDLSDIH